MSCSTSVVSSAGSAGVAGAGAGAAAAVAAVAAGGVPGGAAAGPADARNLPVDGKLTAASLINAIITHQINQNSDQRFPVSITYVLVGLVSDDKFSLNSYKTK